jgi:hypothetical protein
VNTLSGTATDVAGNVGTGSTTFTVGATPEALCALATRFVSSGGVAKSLCSKLDHLAREKGRGDAVRPFVNEVEAQRGKALSADQADLLIRLASAL